MYCRKCGKWIDYDAATCVECQKNEETLNQANDTSAPQTQPVRGNVAPAQEKKGSMMNGFGWALAAVIVAWFGFLITCRSLNKLEARGWEWIVFILTQISIGLNVFSLIVGIKSVRKAQACVKEGKVRPMPTFILGIVAISISGLSLFLLLVPFMEFIVG